MHSVITQQIFQANEEISRLRDRLERELESVYSSKSWGLTAPLRAIAGFGRKGKKILSQVLTSFKNNPTRAFLKIYIFKSRRFIKEALGKMTSETIESKSFQKGVFFEKYKKLLGGNTRKKK